MRRPVTRIFARTIALGSAALLAGCIPPATDTTPPPTPSPTPNAPVVVEAPAPTVAPPAAAHPDWTTAPLTPGDWTYRRAGRESFAEFRDPAGTMLAQVNCTSDRDMHIAVANDWEIASGIRVHTETQEAVLETSAREGWVLALLQPSNRLLDAIAFSRGRFALEVIGGRSLYLPPWPEITRVVEDCR